ncbi:MAG: hypothetical protein NC225_10660 [Clostridium sp.]|nr:hypothetical protein [Clostridium sp.]MCM1460729.1 hypothetical protein [Bacteroides sp.]
MNSIFLKNVPNVGDLFINKILLEYDLEPVIFVCKDNFNNFFLCICDDFIGITRSWIAVKISVEDLIDIINDKITLLSAFKKSESKTIVIDYDPDKETYNYRMMNFTDIDENELPYEDQYLDETETFKDYINYLKLYIISYDIQYDSDYLDTIFIKINKDNQEDNFFIEKKYNQIDEETVEKTNGVIISNNRFLYAA